MKDKKHDFLKFYRPIFTYYKLRHKLTQNELDVLLMLYSEEYFTKKRFMQMAIDFQMPKSVSKINYFMYKGHMCLFRQGRGSIPNVYQLTPKAQKIIASLYLHLTGEIHISEKQAYKLKLTKGVQVKQKNALDLIKLRNQLIPR